jgi:hypothetical protein
MALIGTVASYSVMAVLIVVMLAMLFLIRRAGKPRPSGRGRIGAY